MWLNLCQSFPHFHTVYLLRWCEEFLFLSRGNKWEEQFSARHYHRPKHYLLPKYGVKSTPCDKHLFFKSLLYQTSILKKYFLLFNMKLFFLILILDENETGKKKYGKVYLFLLKIIMFDEGVSRWRCQPHPLLIITVVVVSREWIARAFSFE